MTRKALILGVSGQDGAYLAALLATKGYDLFGTSRDAGTNPFSNLATLGIADKVTTLKADPCIAADLDRALEISDPHEVYNLSGQSSVARSFEKPLETFSSIGTATFTLLECIRRRGRGIRFYHAGSGECFGDTGGVAANEESPLHPLSPYAVAKAAAIMAVANYRRAYGMFACSGILFNHESPLRPARYVTRKIVSAAVRISQGSDETLHVGNLEIQRDWGWAPEYVEPMWLMLQQDRPADYVIATGRMSSLREFVDQAFRKVRLDYRNHVAFDSRLLRPSDIQANRGDPSRARAELGWSARSAMKDVVRMMVAAEQRGQGSGATKMRQAGSAAPGPEDAGAVSTEPHVQRR